jgi:hypothetical protein
MGAKKTEDKTMKNINEKNLENVTGGNIYDGQYTHLAEPAVKSGTYLAVRNAPYFNDANEIAQIWPGNRFYVDLNDTRYGDANYCMANYNGIRGLVNMNYIRVLD